MELNIKNPIVFFIEFLNIIFKFRDNRSEYSNRSYRRNKLSKSVAQRKRGE